MTSDAALAAYEAARARLPDAPSPVAAPERVASLADLAPRFDAFFLDAFGVLNVGEDAIPGAPERIAALQDAGKRVLVVSNAAGFPHDRLMEKYARLGFKFAPEDVVTSRKALAVAVGDGAGRRWGLMVSDGVDAAEFDALDHRRLRDDPEDYDTVDAVLMIGSATWTEERQSLLEAALLERPRPVLVGNPDIVAPRAEGFSVEPGSYAHRLADRTGVAPEFYGKPFANIFDLAFARVPDVPRERIVMVGDSLHTDILGARVAGIAAALVTDHGFPSGRDLDLDTDATGIRPDYVMGSP
ncbi:HAD-IIA family hydrolase [Litorisediminicola beolgyonensis]|uniref:HAD-IIA family hydrolase n=1 Tax=Litorisediminicola beolgyonensis TaxID=1173614 RepID=A0ABW3ZFK5_9RHOB